MTVSEFTQQDYDLIADEYSSLKEAAARRCANEEEMALVQKAFDFANSAHNGVRRRSGEPYMLHPIAVAKIVVNDIGLGCKSICAALLHDVVEDTEYTVEDLRNLFGDKIASLVDGLTKIKTVLDKEDRAKMRESIQAENFKRILLTMNDDVRVVLIKLADRLHNCRTIEYMPEYKRDKILSETMFIFIPLAHRLGLYGVKSEMEDIWLRYKEPEAYAEICGKIERKTSDKESEIDSFIAPIDEALTGAGFRYEIKKRVKTPYSIWHKIQTKGVSFDEVYDFYAVRIIFEPLNVIDPITGRTFPERDQCFHIFSLITAIYKYKPDRIRDWVNHPKVNGYEALHCTLMSNSGTWIEVQIRSRRMNDIAEKGIAAHWNYKNKGETSDNAAEMDKWIIKVKDILANPDVSALELLDIIHNDLTVSDIFVFTPKGDQKAIQKGATALDFAYAIHTHIGNKAIAAKVNMKLVPLSQTLHSGDQVEIITAEDATPRKEWLDFVQTRKARAKISDFFRADIEAEKREEAESKHNSNVRGFSWLWPRRTVSTKTQKYQIASCCHPITGDAIVGFKSSDGSITVHKKTCRVADSLAAKYGDRIVVPDWNDIQQESSLVRLSITGMDRIGILNEITKYISLVMSMNIREFTLKAESNVFKGYLVVDVHDTTDLDKLVKRIAKIEGVKSIIRTEL